MYYNISILYRLKNRFYFFKRQFFTLFEHDHDKSDVICIFRSIFFDTDGFGTICQPPKMKIGSFYSKLRKIWNNCRKNHVFWEKTVSCQTYKISLIKKTYTNTHFGRNSFGFFLFLIRFSIKFAYLFQQTLNLFQQTLFDTKMSKFSSTKFLT